MSTFDFKQDVIDLFNAKNPELPFPLTVDDVDISDPDYGYYSDTPEDNRDIEVIVTAKDSCQHFSGSQKLHWKRRSLTTMFDDLTVRITEATEDWSTMDKIKARVRLDYIRRGFDGDLLDLIGFIVDQTDGVKGSDDYDKRVRISTNNTLEYGATVLVEYLITYK